jgi:hypothetical protein
MLPWIQYGLDVVFFPVRAVPLPWVPLLACLGIAVASPSRQLAQVRVGYLGFGFFALLVALFQIHLHVDGGETFMAWPMFLIQFVALGTLGALMSVLVRSSAGLWALVAATVALAICQGLAFAGVLGHSMNWIARAYVVLVLAISAYRNRDWRSDGARRW